MTAGEIIGRDILPDKPDSDCAACGHNEPYTTRVGAVINSAGSRWPMLTEAGEVLVMLCHNPTQCRKRREAQEASKK